MVGQLLVVAAKAPITPPTRLWGGGWPCDSDIPRHHQETLVLFKADALVMLKVDLQQRRGVLLVEV